MAFVNYAYYQSLYGADAISSADFNRMILKSEKSVKNATTGVDGACKLDIAFPTNTDDIASVKNCICEVLNTMYQIEQANKQAIDGKVVSSVKAGNESVTYSTNGGTIGAVLSDKKAQGKLIEDIIKDNLLGITDKNGVNLLYVGVYPWLGDSINGDTRWDGTNIDGGGF